jgi:hypothetical protein
MKIPSVKPQACVSICIAGDIAIVVIDFGAGEEKVVGAT